MRYLARRLLPALALLLASFVCGALERQAEAEIPGVVPGTVEPSPGAPLADLRLKLNLHIFGLSYHPDREGSRVSHIDNELNYGLGLNHQFYGDDRGVAVVEVGFFKDSGSNWAKFAGVGYQFKLDDRWRFGADLLVLHSETYNRGNTFIAPIPRLTYDIGKPDAVRLNAVYIPKLSDINLFAVFALYVTVQLGHW
jgi:hypothetical protein